jgi:hypothetical protein
LANGVHTSVHATLNWREIHMKETVIFADNDQDVLDAVQDLLQHYNLIKAGSVAEAMYYLHTFEASMLVANARLHGVELLLDVASMSSPKTDVVVITRDDRDRLWADQRGVKALPESLIQETLATEWHQSV